MGGTSWLGLLGTSAPFQSPATAISLNEAAGVLLYSRFQESSAMGVGGSRSSGFFSLGLAFSSSSSAATTGAAAFEEGGTEWGDVRDDDVWDVEIAGG